MKRSRLTPGRPLKRYGNARHELRAWMDREGYERLLREAAARDLSTSKCVRECLHEYFSLKDMMSLPPAAASDPTSHSSPARRPVSLFEAIEAAIAGAQAAMAASARRVPVIVQVTIDPTHLRKIEAGSLPAVGVTRLVAIANALGCATLQELFEAPASREPRGPGRPKKKP